MAEVQGFQFPDRRPQSFFDYWATLRRRKYLILVIVILACATAVGIDFVRAKQYTSTAQLLFLPQGTAQTVNGQVSLSATQIQTAIQTVQSEQVQVAANKAVGQSLPAATVSQIGTTAVATISVTSTNSVVAARAANAYANAYISLATQQFLNSEISAETALQKQLTSVQNQINALTKQIGSTSSTSGAAPSLTSQLSGLYAQQAALQQQLGAIQVAVAQGATAGRILQPATVSTTPSSPKRIQDAAIAGGLGLVIGIAISFILELADDRIRSKGDLDVVAESLPSLGLIPAIEGWRNRKVPLLVTKDRPHSPAAEAYKGLRTSIQFVRLDHPVRKLQITSPAASDGKTTTSANLAVTMAQTGQRVVAVSCDLRRPRIHQFFGVPNDVGLTSVLVGDCSLVDALVSVPGFDNLTLLPSGPVPPNPSEILGNGRTLEIFDTLAAESDLVIFDSPPALPVTDASVLARAMDAVVLVAMAGTTMKRDIARTLELMDRVKAPVAGVVLNRASEGDAYIYYRYGYQYGYGSHSYESSNGGPGTYGENGSYAARAGRRAKTE